MITSKKSESTTYSPDNDSNCRIDIHIESQGDVNIYNCSTLEKPEPKPPSDCPPCFPPSGACIPVAAGAKHKLSREYKLSKHAELARMPSSIAAGAMHMARRFLLGKSPANSLEAAAFATLDRMSPDILSCTVAAFDAVPLRQRNRLFAQSLILDPDQSIDEARLLAAMAQEIVQRVGVQVFDDPHGAEEERPGLIRVFDPTGSEIRPNQVQICSINGLRTIKFGPLINFDFLPAEIQHECETKIVDGQPEVDCSRVLQVTRQGDCPGKSLSTVPNEFVCLRVLEVAAGDAVVLEGVNFFSVDTKVRLTDKQTGNVVREVDAHVWGDLETPVTDENGDLIQDCRVHDRLTFRLPDDLPSAIYRILVVVPNITGINAFGPDLISDEEFINVIPPATARFKIVMETVKANQETPPESFGSDELGLHTLAAAFGLDFKQIDLPSLPGSEQDKQNLQRDTSQEHRFKDIQDVDFDSGTSEEISRTVFEHDQPILGMFLVVFGDEIDDQDAYDQQINDVTDIWIDYLKQTAVALLGAALASGEGKEIIKFGFKHPILVALGALFIAALAYIAALWAPADPLIRDVIGLSVNDLDALTSVIVPAPDPTTFSQDGIRVNVNKTVPPVKLPTEYHETREYVSVHWDVPPASYEITYRYNRVA